MLETTDEKSQTHENIKSIEKDAERIRTFSRSSDGNENKEILQDDVDDLSEYTDEDGGVKVLKDTTSINRKAIFHDLNRLKHWRESIDQTTSSPKKNEKDVVADIPTKEQNFTPIMETNMDIILNSLPDVKCDEEGDNIDDEVAIEKLNSIEKRLSKQYSLQK